MFTLKNILIITVLFFAAVYFMLTNYFTDVQINKYPDIQAVKQDHAIEKGWIPAILPESAYNIEETHDLESNQLFGSFQYKKRDESAIVGKLAPLPDMNATYRWGDFFFKIDTEKHLVKFRNDPKKALQEHK